ncbi:MAG: nitroreductase family protein [Candidatus Omnitrophota bacterium]
MQVYKAIVERRSVRRFKNKKISLELITRILNAGRWAPSGLNNQPWRFVVVSNPDLKQKIAACTDSAKTINSAPCVIAVFLDKKNSYNRDKDMQAVGACVQNMMLGIFDLRLGGCWLGEILNKKTKIAKLLNVPRSYELAAVVAFGYADEKPRAVRRSRIEQLVFKEIR